MPKHEPYSTKRRRSKVQKAHITTLTARLLIQKAGSNDQTFNSDADHLESPLITQYESKGAHTSSMLWNAIRQERREKASAVFFQSKLHTMTSTMELKCKKLKAELDMTLNKLGAAEATLDLAIRHSLLK